MTQYVSQYCVEKGEKLLLFKLFLEENVLNILLSLSLQNYLLCVREKYSLKSVCCTRRNLYHK